VAWLIISATPSVRCVAMDSGVRRAASEAEQSAAGSDARSGASVMPIARDIASARSLRHRDETNVMQPLRRTRWQRPDSKRLVASHSLREPASKLLAKGIRETCRPENKTKWCARGQYVRHEVKRSGEAAELGFPAFVQDRPLRADQRLAPSLLNVATVAAALKRNLSHASALAHRGKSI
jgi:hypothetical protein